MTKMTYVNALDFVLSTYADMPAEVAEKLTALRDAQVKRNATKSDKPTKAQVANMGVKDNILTFLSDKSGVRCGEIAAELDISSQKCAALLTQLVRDAKVVKFEGEKRVTLFKLAD